MIFGGGYPIDVQVMLTDIPGSELIILGAIVVDGGSEEVN